EERIQLYSELMGKREASESALRKDMFSSIIDSFVNDKNESLEEDTLNIELLAYNFHDSLNLKPLFVHLQNKIKASEDPKDKKDKLLTRLEILSEEIIDSQLYVLKEVADTEEIIIKYDVLDTEFITKNFILNIEGIKREIEIQVNEHDAINNRFRVALFIKDLLDENSEVFLVNQSWITLFDFPTVDSVRLSKDGRLSVSITDYDDLSAVLTVALFPGSYASLKEKPYYEDILKQLQEVED
ncbi:MAG: hypothetical protein O6849_08640, partial [Candidatus Dadabacteria bacterium]|nr:hypothetical protein [Candidatus Dadabacteria bacterium]MCZ6865421.1 hypothetical protein [Candidatus Dadabacteria bacterium]